tara:strand:- start:1019 stop:9946 length:8928 start_codon:yes stop_codon:yes gene_type:complete
MPENEEILSNIWNSLSNDTNVSVKAKNFDEWKANFVADPEIQANVYNHLSKNPANNIKAKNQEEWTANVMGKTMTPSLTPEVEGSENGASQSGDGNVEYRYQKQDGKAGYARSINGGDFEPVVDAKQIPDEWFADENFKKVYDEVNTPSAYDQKINTLLRVKNPETGDMDINKTFFNKSEDDAINLLKAQFGDAFDFEPVGYSNETPGGRGSFSAVRIKTKDGKKSQEIEFNIDGSRAFKSQGEIFRHGSRFGDQDKTETQEEFLVRLDKLAYQKAYENLTGFMADNATEETEAANLSSRQKSLDVNKKLQKEIAIGPNELAALNKKYSNPTLFTENEIEFKHTGKNYKNGTTQKLVTKDHPYQKELNTALNQLQAESITPEVEARAREILIEKAKVLRKEKEITRITEALEDGEVLPVSLAEYRDDPDNLKALLEVGTANYIQEYAIKTELYNSARLNLENDQDIKAFSANAQNLNDSNFKFEVQEGEEFVTLIDGRKIPKSFLDEHEKQRAILKPRYEEFFKLQNDLIDNRVNIKDSKIQLDLIRRDYNDLERFFVVSGAGFSDLVNDFTGITSNEEGLLNYQKNKAEIQARRDEYSKTVSFDDAFSSPVNFGRFAANEFANQVSIFAALAIPYAGWGVILGSSYGGQYGEMGLEDLRTGNKRSSWKKGLVSAGYAIPELAFELVTTLPLLRGAGNGLKGMYGSGFRDMTKKGMYEFAVDNTPKFVTGAVAESAGEGATTATQNVVTGKPWHENVDHSAFSGLMIGTTLASVPLLSGAITNSLSDYAVNEEFRKNLLTSNKIKQDNSNLQTKIAILQKRGENDRAKLLTQDLKDNKEKVKDLDIKNEAIIKDQQESLTGRWLGWGKDNKSGMTAGALEQYIAVTTDQEQIRIDAEEINNMNIGDGEKKTRLDVLQKRFNSLEAARKIFKKEKNSEFNLWSVDKKNKAKLEEYIGKADKIINDLDSRNVPSWVKSIKDKSSNNLARVMWNIDKINKNINNAKNNKNDAFAKDLIVHKSVEDAVKAMEALEMDAKDIQSIKNGSHGFDTQGKSHVVVDNMAKDDRLETKTHELSHRLLTDAISSDPKAFTDIAETITKWAKENDTGLYSRLIRQGRSGGKLANDEILAVFLEEAAADRIKLKGLGGVLGFMTTKVMSDKYAYDMDLAGESDAIKMLVGLGKKLKAGQLSVEDIASLKKNKIISTAKNRGDMLKKFGSPVDKKLAKMSEAGSQTTVKSDLFQETNEALIEALELYGMENPERLLSEDRNVRAELASEWEALGDSRFWIGDIIGQKWRRFIEVNYLSKRDKAANYDLYKDEILDMATTGIESGNNGIPFLVRSWKPAEQGGRTLTSHIYGEIETRLMATDGIIDRKFPQFDKFTSQIDESFDDGGVDLEGDLGIDEVLRVEQQKKDRKAELEANRYRVRAGIDNKFAEEIKLELEEVLLSPDLGSIDQFEWTQKFSKTSQKKLFKVIKDQMKDYDTYLKNIRKPFLEHVHTSDLVQMEKMETNKIFLKQIAENAGPNKIKLAFLEGLMKSFEVKSMTQGPNIYKKLDVSEDAFIAFMRVRGRKDAFTKASINIIAMDAVFDILENSTVTVDGKQVPFMDAFIKNQREQGLPSVSNVLSVVKERINRDQDVKFSSTVRGFNDLDLALFYGGLKNLGAKLDIINVGDEDAVKRAVEETWTGENGEAVYSKVVMGKLATDLFKLVSRYNTINKNHINLNKNPEKQLVEYLTDSVKAAALQENLAEFLNLKDDDGNYIKISKEFDDVDAVTRQRAEIETLGHKLIEKYTKELGSVEKGRAKALRMMVMAGGMYSSSTQIGRGNIVVSRDFGDYGQLRKITESEITKRNFPKTLVGEFKEKFSSQRYQSFESAGDYADMLRRVFGSDIKTKALIAETSAAALKDKNFAGREEQAKLAEEFVKDLAQHYKDQIEAGVLSKVDFAMMMMSMASNMSSPLKRAANLKYIYKEKAGQKYKGKFRYEHMIPTNYMVMAITDAYMKNSDVELDALFEQYNVAVIPRTMDDVLENMGFQFTMPINYLNGDRATKRYYNMSTFGNPDIYAVESIDPKDNGKVFGEGSVVKLSENYKPSQILKNAIEQGRKTNKEARGITVLDFDDTLATSKSLIRYTTPEGIKGTLNAEQYAKTYQELTDLGYEWDFSEFNKVVDGKTAPLFNKAMKLQGKFGPENMFVLTARPAEAAPAIYAFLQANGLNIPLKNITGLANSTAESKALWIAEKVGEGYNDFYFADDALQNVQAVDNMLEQFDVKRKVQQARVKFSETMSTDFNNMLERLTGISSEKRFAAIKARKRGSSKGKFRYFIPPSHEDFIGLLYNFMGKGKRGDMDRDFFEKALIRPINRAFREIDAAKQSIANDFKSLNKQYKGVKNKLKKKTPDGDFTYEDAVRIYLWDKHGYDVPGLSPLDRKSLVELVRSDQDLLSYADAINLISKQEKYITPSDGWESGDIRVDLDDATGRVGREQYFAEFNENADIIFSEENLNKIEAAYGKGVREALEDSLYRIKTGRNRPSGQNEQTNRFMNYLNGSVAATMFFNIRSVVLQQMSIVNFINFADNNIVKAGLAFANQPQYWRDWAFIFNSDMMKQRRGGIKMDVNGADLAASLRKSKNPIRSLLAQLLQFGFLPTQIADNVAIATGGASFYRNRVNTYLKQGMTPKEAETKAFTDFQMTAESTQQSARPDMISMQQTSPLGKIILAFQNVTSQFNRIGKKAFLDIKNRRITPGNSNLFQSNISNLSRIGYYFAIQNLIFYSLQTALFTMMFDDDDDENNVLFNKKSERMVNGSIDSVLRGSGVLGAVVSTIKNMGIAFARQRDKAYNPDESAVVLEMLNVSPPLGIKARKLVNAEKTLNYNKKVMKEMEFFDIDNPQWSAYTSIIEGVTNIPLNRAYNKTMNVREGLNSDHENYQRALMLSGWSQYNLNIENEKIENIKQSIKKNKKSSKTTKYKKRSRSKGVTF